MTRDYRPLPEPSWPTVIATTLRLWVQRHVLWPGRERVSGQPTGHRSFGRIGALVLLVAAVAAGITALAFAHARQATPRRSARAQSSSAAPSAVALAAAAASRQQAATWIAAQVSHGVIVACDPLMCNALQQQGFPAASLSPMGASAGDPLGSGIVISTTAVRSQLGPRLAEVYAPEVIASFGSGQSLVQVRVIAAGGAAAYLAAGKADLTARMVAGREIARNSRIRAPAAAKRDLASGQVDSRLLITLAALAHRFPVQVRSFSDSGPGAGMYDPLRRVTLTAPTARYLNQLPGFLRAQRPPLLAAVTDHHLGHATLVQIEFTAPSPTGLLDAGAQQ